MEIRFDQQETKYPDAIKWGDRLLGPKKGKFVESTAQRFSSSSCNRRRIGFPIYSAFQLQIEYYILSGTFVTNQSAGQEILENSNYILILF